MNVVLWILIGLIADFVLGAFGFRLIGAGHGYNTPVYIVGSPILASYFVWMWLPLAASRENLVPRFLACAWLVVHAVSVVVLVVLDWGHVISDINRASPLLWSYYVLYILFYGFLWYLALRQRRERRYRNR